MKSIRICLGSVIPECKWLVRNGGRTQKDFTFFLLLWLGWLRSSMSLIVLSCIRSWKVGTGVAVAEGGKMFLSSNWIGIAFSPKPVSPMNLGVLSVRVFPMMEQEWAD